MGVAYFIVLDNPDPGFDPFVNGKAIAREVKRLSKIAASLGLKSPDDYCSMSSEDAASFAAEFDIPDDVPAAPEQWFEADEGLAWTAALRAHLQAKPDLLKNAQAVKADLAEYESVLAQAKTIGAKWHLSVDV